LGFQKRSFRLSLRTQHESESNPQMDRREMEWSVLNEPVLIFIRTGFLFTLSGVDWV